MRSSAQDYSVESLCWLEKHDRVHSSRVGHPALGLAGICQAHVPILPSVVVSAESFQQFCRSIVWSSPFLNDFPHLSLRLQAEQPFQVQGVAEEIAQGFEATPISPKWLQNVLAELQNLSDCWRLSPSLALPKPWTQFTPLLMEVLPVQYCQLADLGNAIKRTWNSIFTAQTLLLMQEWTIPIDQIRLGLLLQPVGLVKASGFLTSTETHLQIQATQGLSQSMITGEILPDTYTFDRQTKSWHRHPGHITSVYQAHTLPPELTVSGEQGLVQTMRDPAPEQWGLEQVHLDQLLVLAHDLPPLNPSFPVVEWLFPGEDTKELKAVSVWPAMPLPTLQPPQHRSTKPEEREAPLMAVGLAASVGQATAPILVCQDSSQLQPYTVADQIVVLERVVPSDLVWLQQVAGLICTTGGYTSHGAIMARELGLPAVVGVIAALDTFQSGQTVFLDGNQGKVFAAPPPPQAQISIRPPTHKSPKPTLELQTTQLWVNLSQSKLLERALQLPVSGVGLLRSEWFLLDICQGQLPDDWLQQQGAQAFVEHLSHHLRRFVKAWHPRPVFYRSLDCKQGAVAQSARDSQKPAHSMLGLRGASQYMYDSTLFDLELQALAHLCHQGGENIRLLLPFIRSVDEFVFCRNRIQAANLLDHLQVWIMAEVPSVLFQLPEYVAAGVQGIAIGTNDLTQLLLGVDRDYTYLTERYTANHPAVIAALSQLVKTAKTLGIPCSICGQAPVQHSQLIQQLIEWGVTAISVDMSAVPEARIAIATAEERLRSKTMSSSPTTQNG